MSTFIKNSDRNLNVIRAITKAYDTLGCVSSKTLLSLHEGVASLQKLIDKYPLDGDPVVLKKLCDNHGIALKILKDFERRIDHGHTELYSYSV